VFDQVVTAGRRTFYLLIFVYLGNQSLLAPCLMASPSASHPEARYCAVCFFELPTTALPIESTGAASVTYRYPFYPMTPSTLLHDFVGPIRSKDVAEKKAPFSNFTVDSLRKAALRGCNVCAKLDEVMLSLDRELVDKGLDTVISWVPGGLQWVLKMVNPDDQGTFDLFLLDDNHESPKGSKPGETLTSTPNYVF
jgi:hypothetical protein